MISINRSARLLLALLVLSGATACVTTTPQTAPHTPAETLAAPSRWSAEDGPVVMLMGIHNYEQGEFDKAEDFLRTALTLGLPDQRDWARASKYLAFIRLPVSARTIAPVCFAASWSAIRRFR